MPVHAKCLDPVCSDFGLVIVVLNTAGTIQYASDLATKIFELDLQKKKRFVDYLDVSARDAFLMCFKTVLRSKTLYVRKLNVVAQDEMRTFEFAFNYIPNTRVVYVHLIEHDDKQVFSACSQEDKLASIGRLSDGIAHNLKSPLMVLKNIGDYMAMLVAHWDKVYAVAMEHKECPVRAAQDRMCLLLNRMQADISNSVSVMTDLIDNLRTYTRIDKANDFALIDVVDLLKNVIKMAEYNAKLSTSIVLIPPTKTLPKLFCVPSDIQVVCTNILDNAVAQVMARQIKNGRVEVSVEQRHGTILLKFKDNAGGIDKSLMIGNRLFEPFATKRFGGTGLGLHTSFKIIKEHRGNIYARNHKAKMGAGAEFVVILPVS